MNDLVRVGNQEIFIKEYEGRRVVTFKDIDAVHERPEGTANKRFLDNKKRFVLGEDYFIVSNSEIRKSQLFPISDNDYTDKTLITEQGYLMLVKSFGDDLAWTVQRQLVNGYFRTKKPMTIEDMMIAQLQEQKKIKQSVDIIDERVDNLENTMNIDYAQQKQIKEFVSEVVVNTLGGRKSNAYHYVDENGVKLRPRVYSRIWHDFYDYFNINAYANLPRMKFDEALQYINAWQPPTNMQLEIGRINREVA